MKKACLYLLSHCYETDVPALENGDKDKTYTFTPAGFEESEIFKRLIEEHFTPQPLEFNDLKEGMWVWNSHFKNCERIYSINYETKTIRTNDTGFEFIEKEFMENRFYPIQIPKVMEE